jgi:carbonic anhydrase/acetyltransferase-like protein (isoleucine patch superfamily)
MLRCVALIRTNVTEEHSASIIRVTRIGGLGTTLARAKRCNIPEDSILHSHCHENLKYYIVIIKINHEKSLIIRRKEITGINPLQILIFEFYLCL